MACCKCCCGGVDCAEGGQGKCCCGGSSGTCCQEGQYCCSGSCQSEPCSEQCGSAVLYCNDAGGGNYVWSGGNCSGSCENFFDDECIPYGVGASVNGDGHWTVPGLSCTADNVGESVTVNCNCVPRCNESATVQSDSAACPPTGAAEYTVFAGVDDDGYTWCALSNSRASVSPFTSCGPADCYEKLETATCFETNPLP